MQLPDTPPEERFGRITRLACRMLGVRIPRLALVDDNAMLRRLYELEIETRGLDLAVRKASNGIEALVPIGEARPDILVNDLYIPGLDGFGMIRSLRDTPLTARIPPVVVSGMDKPTVLSLGLPEDVPFVTKPALLAAMRAAVVPRLAAPARISRPCHPPPRARQ